MLKRIFIIALFAAFLSACQDNALDSGEDIITEIGSDALPNNAIEFIETNFPGEVISNAYKVTDGTNSSESYEAYLTNETNLVFNASGTLEGFGEDVSKVDCEGRPRRRKGKHHHCGCKPKPEQIEFSALPEATQEYINTNYPEVDRMKALKVEKDGNIHYPVLIAEVGILIFDADGVFIKIIERDAPPCKRFEAIEYDALPESAKTYMEDNYPGAEINRVRMGTYQEALHYHVVVEEVGVIIFDGEGVYLDTKTCGMSEE